MALKFVKNIDTYKERQRCAEIVRRYRMRLESAIINHPDMDRVRRNVVLSLMGIERDILSGKEDDNKSQQPLASLSLGELEVAQSLIEEINGPDPFGGDK